MRGEIEVDKINQLSYIWNKINKLYEKIKEYNLIEIIGVFLGSVIPIAIFLLKIIEVIVKSGYEKYFGLSGVNIIWNTFSFWFLLIIFCLIIVIFLVGNIAVDTCLKKTIVVKGVISRVIECILICLLFYIVLQYLMILLSFLAYSNNNIIDFNQIPFYEFFIFIFTLFTILHICVNENPFNHRINISTVFIILLSVIWYFFNKNDIDIKFYIIISLLFVIMFIKSFESVVYKILRFINSFIKKKSNDNKHNKNHKKTKEIKNIKEKEYTNARDKFLATVITIGVYIFGGFILLNQFGMTIGSQPRYYSIIEYNNKNYIMFNTYNNEKIIMEINNKNENEYMLVEKGTYQYLTDYDDVKVTVQECVIDNGDE